ncbi:Fucose 4-O-acetylase [Halolactibacillus halophilus]|uniref:Acyltransferase n=1 Tax=Halolactibacillus halophilus TaxID=306540 RepID=A0A1I5M7D1_9BACI|nr:acyltransferase family protein [Halolactibacillus halophilus]GEM01022.1 acyltransferase [Halolactibacillus halophilus]SFP04856.1 Fucose 4-O-acetylase [Halolactibacillus halophilus]
MKRDYFFDNARVLLIFLVVFGHVIQPSTGDSQLVMALYQTIYLFHMPAMIFVSGFFAKGKWNLIYLKNLIKKLVVPYVLFQLLYNVMNYFEGESVKMMLEPNWSLWFLLSLFSWHLLLALFKRLPTTLGLLLAVGIGLGVGYFDMIGHEYSLSRTFVFFPFFLLGYHVNKQWLFYLLDRTHAKLAGILIVSIVGIHLFLDYPVKLLFGSASYEAMGSPVMGVVSRGFIYLGAILLSLLFLAIVPKQAVTYSKMGQKTLYVYLLHGLFIQIMRHLNLFQIEGLMTFIGAIVISGGLVLLLSSRVVTILFKPLLEFKAVKQ